MDLQVNTVKINVLSSDLPKSFDQIPHIQIVLRDWGINVIRLEFNWVALKPQEDEISQHYLDIIEKIIDNAGLHGVYVIIDFHQDGLSKRLGAIDAVPNWVMDKIEPPPYLFQYPWPLKKDPDNAGPNLLSFYDYLVNVIRQSDKDTLIFYESVTYGIYFPSVNGLPGTGIRRVPGLLQDEMARKKSVLSYHYYCWLLESTLSTKNMPSWKRYLCDKLKSFSRTYPQSTAGQPVKLRFDVDSGVFYYVFVPTQKYCTNVDAALLVAEIFVPMSIHYPYGLRTRFVPEQLYYKMYENNTNLMFVYAPCTLINTNIELMEITIIPNQTQDKHSDNNYSHLPTYSKSVSILLIVNSLIFSHLSTYFV
ncbi:unnamed protein product [Schistosoma curassoni]|nr:unnamed protein product [Schistosoma curassoni]